MTNKAIPNTYAGDDFRWFVATVVNHTPPAGFEGRVQVRIRGIHSPKTDKVPQVALPWAQVLIPGTEEGSSGLGSTPKITTGALVWGFFLDGTASQIPVVVGSFVKNENQTPIQDKKRTERTDFIWRPGSSNEYTYVDSFEELLLEFKVIKREVDSVVIDWTETYNNKDIDASDVDHMAGGDGYHYVILRDGTIQRQIQVNRAGDHTDGSYNDRAIAVALVGGINVPSGMPQASQYIDGKSITRSQLDTLEKILYAFYREYPNGTVLGANQIVDTQAPGFDVSVYVSNVFGK